MDNYWLMKLESPEETLKHLRLLFKHKDNPSLLSVLLEEEGALEDKEKEEVGLVIYNVHIVKDRL